jgi:hypothetical protein
MFELRARPVSGWRVMRTRVSICLVLIALIAGVTAGADAMAVETPKTLATSAGKPVALGAGPVSVTLAPERTGQLSVARERKVYLVVRGLGTNEQPEVTYQLYLGLPPGTAPSPNGPYYVGSVNFFNARTPGMPSDPRFYSFDVTNLLRSTESSKSLGDRPVVTVVPGGKPRNTARPTIGEIALVEQ